MFGVKDMIELDDSSAVTQPSEESRLEVSGDIQPALPESNAERIYAELLAELLGVDHVAADSHFFDDLGADSMMMARFCARVRKRADVSPVSMKDVYASATVRQLAATLSVAEPVGEAASSQADVERIYASLLAEILGVDHVAADRHFFDDLGADSLVMARFCARVRKRTDLPPISMKDIYASLTIAKLAASFAVSDSTLVAKTAGASTEPVRCAANWEVALCGALQLVASLAYVYVTVLILIPAYFWVTEGAGVLDIYTRALLVTFGIFVVFSVLPIAAKWLLIGRWTARKIRIWSLDYVRFWFVKSLMRANPLLLFAGTPLYIVYLRAMGAKIGRNVVILSNHVPVCTDLLTIGDNAVIRKDAYFNGYRARGGVIETGSVSLGKESVVGEMTVLDINTSLGDGAQLGHASSLDAGQSIPDNEHRHGTPANQNTNVDYRVVAPGAEITTARKVAYCLAAVVPFMLILPVIAGAILAVLSLLVQRSQVVAPGALPFLHSTFFADAFGVSTLLFFGSLIIGLILVGTLPRILNRALKPRKVYPLYGLHYWVHRTIGVMSNVKFFTYLFGDSAYIVNYLKWIGYDLSNVVQTGSNFGMEVKQDNPFLVSVGSGTMVADGLSLINTDYSSTSFQLSKTTVGADTFVGNFVAYPAQAKTGDNCLLATKVMVPLDGAVREGVGLLGSPSFEIPRSVERDRKLGLNDHAELEQRLAAKNTHNLATMGQFLFVHWVFVFAMTCMALAVVGLLGLFTLPVAALVVVLAIGATPFLRAGYYILVERLSTGFQSLKPLECSIYDRKFWTHERHWKLMATTNQLAVFDGTPFKALAWRLLGVKIGARVFDDGGSMTERTMVAIGDDCTLNMASIIHPHSQEDGGFKSDRVALGARCTLGVGAWAHYGARLGDDAELGTNAFLMKGQEVPARTRWAENPANEINRG